MHEERIKRQSKKFTEELPASLEESKVPSNKFKMYAGFNGEFRRKPVVSIRGVGASKKETKEDLVKRLKEERAEREVSYFQHLF